jgi:hypothetical protein
MICQNRFRWRDLRDHGSTEVPEVKSDRAKDEQLQPDRDKRPVDSLQHNQQQSGIKDDRCSHQEKF